MWTYMWLLLAVGLFLVGVVVGSAITREDARGLQRQLNELRRSEEAAPQQITAARLDRQEIRQ